jgi:hypothetical protein
MLYTGVDHHRSFSYLTTMNGKGEIIAQKKLPSNGEIVDFLKSFGESLLGRGELGNHSGRA